MKTDDQLLEAYAAGDESAFAELVEKHLQSVYAFIYRLVGKKEEAEDIAQETFVKAWKNIKRFKKGMNLKTWLFAIARNSSIDYLRKRKALMFSDLSRDDDSEEYEHGIRDTAPTAEMLFDAKESTIRIEAALQKMPLMYREIIILHYREEMTLDEAAHMLNIPLNTAKSRDRRALQALRKHLGPEKP